MRKNARNDELGLLDKLGLNSDRPNEESVARLRALRGAPGVSDAAIARALGSFPVADAVAMLVEMEAETTGASRREVRRALFRLRQRGVKIPDTLPKIEHTAASIADSDLSALLSPIDPDGARVVWIIKDRAQGGVRRLWGLASSVEGLLKATLNTMSRRELRTEREEFERRAKVKMIDADSRLADFVLFEAYHRTPEGRRSEVGDFLALRSELIASAPPSEFEHPIYAEFASRIPSEAPTDLLREPEIAGWRLPASEVKPFIDEINEIRQSPLLLNRPQQDERVNGAIGRAIEELFSGPPGERARRLLEDIAYYMARSGRQEAAGWSVAAATAIRAGVDLKHQTFFQAFARAQLGAMLAEEAEHAREQPRLIMTPAEAMRVSQARTR